MYIDRSAKLEICCCIDLIWFQFAVPKRLIIQSCVDYNMSKNFMNMKKLITNFINART